ncbi:MAG: SEL1-like repeat protein [Methylococcales bacterium]|nr:SEL1-like repeat protein [Methylococcales bacterium]
MKIYQLALFMLFSCLPPYLSAMTIEQGLNAFQRGNLKQAQLIWEPLAEDGNSLAQFYLSILCQHSSPPQPERSLYWLNLAAQADYPPALFNLGSLYFNSEKPSLNKEETAAYWWQRAAELGFAKAQYNLAKLYWVGHGVEKNLHKAHYWFKKADGLGMQQAKDSLILLNDEIQKTLDLQLIDSKVVASSSHTPHNDPSIAGQSSETKPKLKHPRPIPPEQSNTEKNWVMQQPAQNYTIQFYVLSSKNNCSRQTINPATIYGLETQTFHTENNGKPFCYVLHGSFSDKQLAKKEAMKLPASQHYLIRQIAKFHEMNKLKQTRQ